ncbi:MAG: 5-bromo-4-chloroindolyl phosphate hydrolysis family protein [Bacillota bacterium]|nr:5-bromo-4-chloroindolyl phosphate hydrolysis family protein [Bacillota bacterium]
MAGKDWNNLGQDLNRIVEDAVHMGNFGRLNETINSTLRKAFQGMDPMGGSSGPGGQGGGWDFDLSGGSKGQRAQTAAGEAGGADGFETGDAGARRTGEFRQTSPAMRQAAYFAGSGKRRGGAIGMLAGGIVLTALSGISLIFSLLSMLIFPSVFGAPLSGFSLLVLIAGIVLIVKGSRGLKLAKRFDQYVRILNGKTYGDIKTLAAYANCPEETVRKDVKKMLQKGWFLQGHLDQKETCLMVSHETYQKYMETVKHARLQKEEELRRKEAEAAKEGLTPEAKAVLEEGEIYIRKIRESNDAIPGEEISDKIFRMELLVRRIFDQAEAHPENIPDLRKLMEYYLPMTIKLLDAYEELDQQPVQGENIINSKNEIEQTLDTLNLAFEKLLDNLFQDTAWDVSSDISVLKTMLAQEGLTEDGFPKGTGKKN